MRSHSTRLTREGFVSLLPPEELTDLSRYLEADKIRLEKVKNGSPHEAEWMWKIEEAQAITEELRHKADISAPGKPRDAAIKLYQQALWLSEEFRVSLWAQELGVKQHPSLERLKRLMKKG